VGDDYYRPFDVRERIDDNPGILPRPSILVFTGEIDRDGLVPGHVELIHDALPAPSSVSTAMN
jgi:hypothetical protein